MFFDFMKQTLYRLNELYLREICILVDAIMIDQFSKQSAAETEKLEKHSRNKRKEGKSKPSKKPCFVNKTTQKFEQQVTPPYQNLMQTYHIGLTQPVVTSKRLEYVSIREKSMLIL